MSKERRHFAAHFPISLFHLFLLYFHLESMCMYMNANQTCWRLVQYRFVGSFVCRDISTLSMLKETRHFAAHFLISLFHLFLLSLHIEIMVHVYECMHVSVRAIGK